MFAFSKPTLLVAVKSEKSESKFLLSRTFWMCATSLTLAQKLEFDTKVAGPGLPEDTAPASLVWGVGSCTAVALGFSKTWSLGVLFSLNFFG